MLKTRTGQTKKNRWVYFFITLLFMVIVGAVALYSYINSDNFRAQARSFLTTKLETLLQKRIEIGSVDTISFQSLQITHLVISANNSGDNEILFQAGEVEIKFALFFPFWQNKIWQLDIKNIIFSDAPIELTRDSAGEFDLVKKLGLDLAYLHENITIGQISFRNCFLIYHDELVYHYPQNYLTTKVKDVQVDFNLIHWPQVEFTFKGIQEADNALLALGGFFVINKREYSLDFHLQNADIAHFQYYLEAAEQFNATGGKFDLELNLSFSPEWDSDEISWQGNATFHRANAQPYFLKEISLLEINGEVNFKKPEITLTELTGLYQNSAFLLEGLVLTSPDLYYDLKVNSKQIEASLLRDDILLFVGGANESALHGKVDLSADIEGLPGIFSIKGTVEASEIALENIPFNNITGNFLFNQDELIIDSLQSQSKEGSILVKGSLNWSTGTPSCHFDIKTSGLSFQNAVFQQFPSLAEFSGIIDSNFQLKNRAQNNENSNTFDLTGNLNINNLGKKDFSFPEQATGVLKAALNLTDATLSLEQCELVSGKNSGSLQGELQLTEPASLRFDWQTEIPDLTIFNNLFEPDLKVTGSASLQGEILGSWKNPILDMELQLTDFAIQDYEIVKINGQLSYQQESLSVKSYTFANQDLKIMGNGTIDTAQSGRPEINLSYQLQPLSLKPLLEKLNYDVPFTGQAEGSGNIRGFWPELTINGNLRLEEIAYQEYQLGQGKIDFLLQPEQSMTTKAKMKKDSEDKFFNIMKNNYILNLEHLQLQNEVLQVNASGQAGIGKEYPFSLEAEFEHYSFSDLVAHFYPTEDYLQNLLPSKITGRVESSGNSAEQKFFISCQLASAQQENDSPSKLEASFDIDQTGINISDFQFVQSGSLLKAGGKVAITGDLDIYFQTEQLDIEALMNTIQIEENIKGIIDLKGSLTGKYKEPHIALTALIKNGYFREFQFENLKSELLWNSTTNQIEVNELTIDLGNKNNITVKGNIPITNLIDTIYNKKEEIHLTTPYRDVPLNLEMKMDQANLNLLKIFWPKTFSEISGTGSMELNFTGTAAHPIVNGTIEIEQGIVNLANLPIQIGEVNDQIKIVNNKATIPVIPFRAYENRLNLSGEFILTGFLPDSISFSITSEDNRIVYQNILESGADLKLTITNLLNSPNINGQILLHNGVLNIDNLIELEEDINLAFSSQAFNSRTSEQMAVHIELQDPFQLKMPNAEIFISSRIELKGSLAEPALQGTIALKKGYVLYFDKKFSIIDGLITLNGVDRHNIELNARASSNIQGVEVKITVLGNLYNPQVLLSSQPSLKETEILSLLAFNRNIQGLSEGEISQILSQEMLEVLFQSLQMGLFSRMEHKLATGLGLEFIKISLNEQNNGSSYFFLDNLQLADLTLEVGKSIGDDIFVSYSTPLDFHGETNLGMDYKLSPGFTFSTQLENFSFKKEDYKIRFGLELRF